MVINYQRGDYMSHFGMTSFRLLVNLWGFFHLQANLTCINQCSDIYWNLFCMILVFTWLRVILYPCCTFNKSLSSSESNLTPQSFDTRSTHTPRGCLQQYHVLLLWSNIRVSIFKLECIWLITGLASKMGIYNVYRRFLNDSLSNMSIIRKNLLCYLNIVQ